VLAIMRQRDINVEYMYAFFITVDGDAVVLFRIEEQQIESTIELLEQNDVRILSAEEVYAL